MRRQSALVLLGVALPLLAACGADTTTTTTPSGEESNQSFALPENRFLTMVKDVVPIISQVQEPTGLNTAEMNTKYGLGAESAAVFIDWVDSDPERLTFCLEAKNNTYFAVKKEYGNDTTASQTTFLLGDQDCSYDPDRALVVGELGGEPSSRVEDTWSKGAKFMGDDLTGQSEPTIGSMFMTGSGYVPVEGQRPAAEGLPKDRFMDTMQLVMKAESHASDSTDATRLNLTTAEAVNDYYQITDEDPARYVDYYHYYLGNQERYCIEADNNTFLSAYFSGARRVVLLGDGSCSYDPADAVVASGPAAMGSGWAKGEEFMGDPEVENTTQDVAFWFPDLVLNRYRYYNG